MELTNKRLFTNSIIKIHKEKKCKQKDMLDYPNLDYKNFKKVIITIECNKKIKKIEKIFEKQKWEDIKEEGFFITNTIL